MGYHAAVLFKLAGAINILVLFAVQLGFDSFQAVVASLNHSLDLMVVRLFLLN